MNLKYHIIIENFAKLVTIYIVRDAILDMRVCHLLKILGKLSLGLLLSFVVNAGEPTMNGSVPIPNPPKAKERFSTEQACVKSIDIMRRNHGKFLKHSRDDTMRRGVRTIPHSLKGCINCHVTADANGNYPSIKEGVTHFCRSCHTYAAVTIDCFQCHASQPIEPSHSQVNTIKPLTSLGTPNTLP